MDLHVACRESISRAKADLAMPRPSPAGTLPDDSPGLAVFAALRNVSLAGAVIGPDKL